MSHAVYHFLLALDVDDRESAEKIRAAAQNAFDMYAEGHTDDNNWSAPIDVVLRDDRVIPFEKEASDRYKLAKHPWKEAVRYALDCVATDLDFWEHSRPFGLGKASKDEKKELEASQKLSDQEFYAAIVKKTAQFLSGAYALLFKRGPPKRKKEDLGSEDWLEAFRRDTHAAKLAHLMSCNLVPFTTSLATPYEYRAYDLTQGDEEPNAILRVDIHT